MTGVWLAYRAHRELPRHVETLCVLSEGIDLDPVLRHPLLRDYAWEKIGERAYHAYDSVWEYKLEHWKIDDSLTPTNWVAAERTTV